MSKETILIVGDSIEGPTGFANDLAGIAWSLADEYEVHVLGLQSLQHNKVNITIHNKTRSVIQHPNFPRKRERFDFGERSLPVLLDNLEPDILLTVNDIQMVAHVPETMCPNTINIPVIDLPSKKFISQKALLDKVNGEITKFKEKYPRDTKWIMYAPQDGDPPMPNWSYYYNMADQVIAMSKYGKAIFKQYYDLDVPYIWHGVDTDLFKKRDKPDSLKDKFVLGNLNRNQPRKQPIRTIQAFAKFAKDKDDVLLHMQMDWNDQFGWPLSYFVQLYGIQNKIIPPVRVGMPREDVAGTYNLWDLNLHATAGEGFGLCIAEGMASGLPTLATDYTTSKELIIEGTPSPRGSLLKVIDLYWDKMDVAAVRRALVDIDDYVKALNKYYYNRDLVEEHGKNAREWTEKNLAWKIIQKKWKKQIDDVLSK